MLSADTKRLLFSLILSLPIALIMLYYSYVPALLYFSYSVHPYRFLAYTASIALLFSFRILPFEKVFWLSIPVITYSPLLFISDIHNICCRNLSTEWIVADGRSSPYLFACSWVYWREGCIAFIFAIIDICSSRFIICD